MTAYRDVYDAKMQQQLSRFPTAGQLKKIRSLTPYELFEELAYENIIFGCCTAYSHRCFKQYGHYDERYRLIEDHSMILRLTRQGVQVTFFDEVVVRYRSNGASSAMQYNEVYERDVDQIFNNEVLPYTINQKRVQKRYKRWKEKQQMARNLHIHIQQTNGNLLYIFGLRMWFHLHYPIDSIRGFLANPIKIKKLFRNL